MIRNCWHIRGDRFLLPQILFFKVLRALDELDMTMSTSSSSITNYLPLPFQVVSWDEEDMEKESEGALKFLPANSLQVVDGGAATPLSIPTRPLSRSSLI